MDQGQELTLAKAIDIDRWFELLQYEIKLTRGEDLLSYVGDHVRQLIPTSTSSRKIYINSLTV